MQNLIHFFMVLIGVNSAEMVPMAGYIIVAKRDGNSEPVEIKMKRATVMVPLRSQATRHYGSALSPCVILGEWSPEQKCVIIQYMNSLMLEKWKWSAVGDNIDLIKAGPMILWAHPGSLKQPETLCILGRARAIGEILNMDAFKYADNILKCLQPFSTPIGWELRNSNFPKKLKFLAIDESELKFKQGSLMEYDGVCIIRSIQAKWTHYVSPIARFLGAFEKPIKEENPCIQDRLIDTKIGKFLLCPDSEKFEALANKHGIRREIRTQIFGIMAYDNIKNKSVKAGEIFVVEREQLFHARTMESGPNQSSSLGVQSPGFNQVLMKQLYREYAWEEVRDASGQVSKIYSADIFGKAAYKRDMDTWMHIIAGNKESYSYEDLKRVVVQVCALALPNKDGSFRIPGILSYMNQLRTRLLTYLHQRVWKFRVSNLAPYAIPSKYIKVKDKWYTELDELKYRLVKEGKGHFNPCFPCQSVLEDMVNRGKEYLNVGKTPLTSAYSLMGRVFCYRDEGWKLQAFVKEESGKWVPNTITEIREEIIADRLKSVVLSKSPNAIEECTPIWPGYDFDGDTLLVCPSKSVYLPVLPMGFTGIDTSKEKVELKEPETLEDWVEYVTFINQKYEMMATAQSLTGQCDNAARMQFCTAILKGDIDPEYGIPFNPRVHRKIAYWREEAIGGLKRSDIESEGANIKINNLGYGKIRWSDQPHIFTMLNRYGGVAPEFRHHKGYVLNKILEHVSKAEDVTYYLNTAVAKIKKWAGDSKDLKLEISSQIDNIALSLQHKRLWGEYKDKLISDSIFSINQVQIFAEAVNAMYTSRSKIAQNDPNKKELFGLIALGLDYLLRWHLYNRPNMGPVKCVRKYMVSRYLKLQEHEALVVKEEKDMAEEELKRFNFVYGEYQKRFSEARDFIDMNKLLTLIPNFKSITDVKERVTQIDNFLQLALMWTGKEKFGVKGIKELSGGAYLYYPPEIAVMVAKKRFHMLEVNNPWLNNVMDIVHEHRKLEGYYGFTVEEEEAE